MYLLSIELDVNYFEIIKRFCNNYYVFKLFCQEELIPMIGVLAIAAFYALTVFFYGKTYNMGYYKIK